MQPTYPRVQPPAVAPIGGAHPLAPAPGPATPPKRPGFGTGVSLFFKGIGQLISTPGLYPLAAVPMLVVLLLTGVLGWAAVAWVPDLVAYLTGSGAWWAVVLQTLATVLAVVIALFVALLLAQPLSGPALEALVRRVEASLGLPARPPTPFVVDIWRGLGSALMGLLFGAPILTVLVLLNLIPGASIVVVPLKFVVTLVLISWDLCDYPLSVRGVSLRERLAFIVKNFWAVMGFSLGVGLVGLIPCGALFILPAGVVGATHLAARIEAFERASRG